MLSLTPVEQEVVTLKAVLDMIGDMVNHGTMKLHGSSPEQSIMFHTSTHMALFNIILVDLLSKPAAFLVGDEDYIGRLLGVCADPLIGEAGDIQELARAVASFSDWLSEKATVPGRWFPSLSLAVDLCIERRIFIRICGNIAKHNFTRLTQVAGILKTIFAENGVPVPLDKCILALQDFRLQFYDDVFHYHSSTIAAFLNNICWGIHSYAAPVRGKCVEAIESGIPNLQGYKYRFPVEVTSEMGRTCYGELMNDVTRQPNIERFEVASYLKTRY